MSQFSPLFLYLYPQSEQAAVRLRTTAFTERIASIIQSENFEELAVSEEGEAILKDAQPYFALIDEAQKRKNCLFVHAMDFGALLPHAQTAQDFARLTQLDVVNACKKTDFRRAERTLQRLLRLSRDLRPQAAAIVDVVSVSLDETAVELLLSSYLGHPRLTADECDRILAILKDHQRSAAGLLNEGIKSEYVMLVNTIEGFRGGKLKTESLGLEKLDPFIRVVDFEVERDAADKLFSEALSATINPHQVDNVMSRLTVMIDDMKSGLEKETKSLVGSIPLALGFRKLRNPLICVWFAPGVNQFIKVVARDHARLNGAILLTAVRRYQLQHGKLPELLQTAAKEVGLDAVPLDPYDPEEGPMRYSIVNGKPVVYSIGPDGKDDGGMVDWNFGRQPGDILFTIP